MANEDGTVSECIAHLVSYNGSLQMAHWLADTVTNEHKALGDLYESMVDLVDSFAEVYMGKHGVVSFPDDTEIEDITDAPASKGLEVVDRLQSYFQEGVDSDLLNILADMQAAMHKAQYLLKEGISKEPKEAKEPKVAEAISRKMEEEE